MRFTSWLRVFLWLALWGTCSPGLPAVGAVKPVVAAAAGKVGLVTRDYPVTQTRNWRGSEAHSLHVLVWYPAVSTAVETQQTVGPPEAPLFLAGSATPHAPFAPAMEKLPLILLSHGAGGSAEQMGWLGTALAGAGFMAVAVDHPGSNSKAAYTAEGFVLWWERATDLSEVLDGILADPELGTHVDGGRVGVAGYSLGGLTALQLGGAQTDISGFFDRCKAHPEVAVCQVSQASGLGTPDGALAAARKTSGESLAKSGGSYRDPRVKAVFAIAPALAFTLTPESLHAMRLPVDMVVGSADAIAPSGENASYVRGQVRGARATVLPGVGHAEFMDECTAAGMSKYPQFCTDGPGVDRHAVHEQVSGMAVQFFERALR